MTTKNEKGDNKINNCYNTTTLKTTSINAKKRNGKVLTDFDSMLNYLFKPSSETFCTHMILSFKTFGRSIIFVFIFYT